MNDDETIIALVKAIRLIEEALRLTKQADERGLLNDEERGLLNAKRDDMRRWLSDITEVRNIITDRIEV